MSDSITHHRFRSCIKFDDHIIICLPRNWVYLTPSDATQVAIHTSLIEARKAVGPKYNPHKIQVAIQIAD